MNPDDRDARESVEAVNAIRKSRTPMSWRVLPSRPAAWAALVVAAAQFSASRTPSTRLGIAGGMLIYIAAAFIVVWNSRVRRDWREWKQQK